MPELTLIGGRHPAALEGWTHFTQGPAQRARSAGYGLTERLRLPVRGVPLRF